MDDTGRLERFSVRANRGQLEKAGLMHEEWEPDARVPNMVRRYFFSLDAAINQYCTLRTMGLVALKNWLT